MAGGAGSGSGRGARAAAGGIGSGALGKTPSTTAVGAATLRCITCSSRLRPSVGAKAALVATVRFTSRMYFWI